MTLSHGRKMKILLAGATGVIGRALLPLLLPEGYEVVAISRRASQDRTIHTPAAMKRYSVDVFDRDALMKLFVTERPDAVIHQLTDLKEQSSAANARLRTVGTRNLVDAARSAGVASIVAQSIAWAYEPADEIATENTPLDIHAQPPRSTTIDGTVALESAVSEIAHHVILRYGTLHGPGTWYARDGSFAQQVRSGAAKATSAITNFVHIEDAAQAALLALRWPSGAVNIADDSPSRATEWLPVYAEEIGAPAPIADAPVASPTRPVSNAYARALGWKPRHRSWKDGFVPASD